MNFAPMMATMTTDRAMRMYCENWHWGELRLSILPMKNRLRMQIFWRSRTAASRLRLLMALVRSPPDFWRNRSTIGVDMKLRSVPLGMAAPSGTRTPPLQRGERRVSSAAADDHDDGRETVARERGARTHPPFWM